MKRFIVSVSIAFLMLGQSASAQAPGYDCKRTKEEVNELGCRISKLIDGIVSIRSKKLPIFSKYLFFATYENLHRPIYGEKLDTKVCLTHVGLRAGTDIIGLHSTSYNKWKEKIDRLPTLIRQHLLTLPNFLEVILDFNYGRSECQECFFFTISFPETIMDTFSLGTCSRDSSRPIFSLLIFWKRRSITSTDASSV